jgi:hypothetical protein
MYENDDGIIVKVPNNIYVCVKTEKYDNGIVKLPKSSVLQFVII